MNKHWRDATDLEDMSGMLHEKVLLAWEDNIFISGMVDEDDDGYFWTTLEPMGHRVTPDYWAFQEEIMETF